MVGHTKLTSEHRYTTGATGDLIDRVAEQMVKEKKIRVDRAKEILEELTKG